MTPHCCGQLEIEIIEPFKAWRDLLLRLSLFFFYVYIYFGERGGWVLGAYLVIHGPFGFTIVIL